MRVDENKNVVVNPFFRLLAKLKPSLANIDAFVLQPPKHRDGIRHVEVILGFNVRSKLAVVVSENRIVLAPLQVKKRPMPPHVISKIVAVRPRRLGRG